MAPMTIDATQPPPASEAGRHRIGFDRAAAPLAAWKVGGLFLDGWAHMHVPQMETFFTPWHAVLYSGFGAMAAALTLATWRWRVVPAGYGTAVAGSVVFLLGGVADMIWHTVFGIEVSVEALLSPSHLLLAAGFVLMVSGPAQAAWMRPDRVAGWPALLSLALTFSVLTFFTSYAHPFVDSWAANAFRSGDVFGNRPGFPTGSPDPYYLQALGIAAILLQSALLVAFMVAAIQRRALQSC